MGVICRIALLLLLTRFIDSATNGNLHSGHLLPLGSHTTPINVKRLTYLPSPTEFYLHFVEKRTPVVMEGAMTATQIISNWQSDTYLREMFGDIEFNVEDGKKENRSAYGFSLPMAEFLDIYKDDDIYMVGELPPPMVDEWQLPKPLLCGGFTDHLMYAFIWFSSGGTRSVLHTDSGENLHCVVSGRKEWVLIEPRYAGDIGAEHKQKGYYDIDVDRVDMTRYYNLSNIPWYSATLEEGDCLFLPHPWIHQVRSFGRNMGVNVWWEQFEFDHCDGEEELPDFLPLASFEFHPEIQVRDDLIKMQHKDGCIYAKDFHILLKERLELEGLYMEVKFIEKMFDILQPGCHGVIEDPYSISLDKLRAAFDYILSVSDELFEEQATKEMEEQEQEDYTNEFVTTKERDEL